MKAVYVDRLGGLDSVRHGDRPTPEPGAHQVLIEVHAAGVNPRDWQLCDGTYAFRHLSGRLPIVLGSDVSGVVVRRGRKVTGLDVGDEVFAMQTTFGAMGGYAEYIAVNSAVVARKPPSVSHVEAAAVVQSGLTAWQALHRMAGIKAGHKIVVVGASGGVGHLAAQFARHSGATVTAVCGPDNVDLVRGLGADTVLDYTREQFTEVVRGQDIVLDTIGRESLHSTRPTLATRGRYLTTTPTRRATSDWLTTSLTGPLLRRHRAQLVLVMPSAKDLTRIAELLVAGHVRSVIEEVYPLEDAVEALRKSRGRHARGKLVLKVR